MREREKKGKGGSEGVREVEQPLSPQLNELLTRFTDGGKSSIRKSCLSFSPLLPLPMAPLSHAPLLIQRIPSSIILSARPSLGLTLQHTTPRLMRQRLSKKHSRKNSIIPEHILHQIVSRPFFEVLYCCFLGHDVVYC